MMHSKIKKDETVLYKASKKQLWKKNHKLYYENLGTNVRVRKGVIVVKIDSNYLK